VTMHELAALSARVRQLQADGKIPSWPTPEQYEQWAFGQTSISNPLVTPDHAKVAASKKVRTR
jgi:hypothetical protein